MLKLLSRSIRNDSESLAADLTNLQSMSPYWFSQHTMPQASPSDTQQYFILGRCRVVGFMFHILNERSRKLWWSTAALNRQWGHSRCVARLRSWDASIVQCPAPQHWAADRWWTHYWGQLQGDCTIIALYLYTLYLGPLQKPCFMRNTSLLVPSILILLPPSMMLALLAM